MRRLASLVLAAAACAVGPVDAQTVLSPLMDASLVQPPGARANDRLFVVQPSVTGPVWFAGRMTGDTTGTWIGVPLLSLNGDYQAGNTALTDTFCDIDVFYWLVFPNNLIGDFFNWTSTLGPFQPGMVPRDLPAFEISDPFFEDIAMYIQTSQIEFPAGMPGYTFNTSFSGGLFLINKEPVPQDLDPPVDSPDPALRTAATAQYGRSMAVGDLNGDGYQDLAVGAPGDYALGFPGAGRVYLYLGSASGLAANPYILEEPDLAPLLMLPPLPPGIATGPAPGAHFGDGLAFGDLDDDGRDELVVGIPDSDAFSGDPSVGEVMAFTALEMLVGTSPPAQPTLLAVPLADVTPLRPDQSQVPQATGDRFGLRLACGDVDGDGIDDVAAAAPFHSESLVEREKGLVFVFLGEPGFTQVPVSIYQEHDLLVEDTSPGPYRRLGFSLALRDLDSSGTDELLVGAPGDAVAGQPSAGTVRVMAYEPAWSMIMPVYTLESPAPAAQGFFGQDVAVGHVTGDPALEIVVGADEDAGSLAQAGRVHVFDTDPAGPVLLFSIDSPNQAADERFGRYVRVADVNDDGLGDVLVGAPGAVVAGDAGAGRAYIFFGTTLGGPFVDTFRTLQLTPSSSDPNGLFGAGLAVGDFSGSGVGDLMVAEPQARLTPAGFSFPVSVGRVGCYTDLLSRRTNINLQQAISGQH